jgi:hypothetical protein
MAATGIRKRHARGCPSRGGRACSCRPTFEASVWSTREGKKIRKSFRTESAAKSWRADATVALRKGELRSPTRITLRQAAEVWLEGAEAGRIRTRSGDAYKPSAIRGYESGIRTRLLPEFGAVRLSELRRRDLQDFADRILAEARPPRRSRTSSCRSA